MPDASAAVALPPPSAAADTFVSLDTPKGKKRKLRWSGVWAEASRLIADNKWRLVLGFFIMLLGRAAGFVTPLSSKWLLDDIIPHNRHDLLVPLALAVIGAALLQAATTFALANLLGIAAQRAINEMRKNVQAHITRLPLRYFDATQSGSLISRIMRDAEGIRNLVGNGIVELVGGVLTALVALIVLFYLNWQLTLMIVVVLAVFGAAMSYTFVKLRPVFRERGAIEAEVTGRLGQSLGGIRVVKAYVAEEREQKVFAAGVNRIFDNIRRSIAGVHGITAFSSVIIGISSGLLIYVGGTAMLNGTMTPGDFMVYVFFTAMVAWPLIGVANIGTQITEALAGLDRIREVREILTEDAGDENRASLENIRGEISVEGVTYSYVPGRPVLRNINFSVPAGSTVALVGPSGSGKSTLIGMVMAFQRPEAGCVKVDGKNLADVRLRDWRRQIGLVLQENFLFDGTVAENIAFSRPDATREQIMAAAETARVDDFVKDFPEGYDTVVGERGVKLSGGQRQRVAIARALLADPRVLILDEATSSLDSESEALIQAGLEELRKGRTTFVIAHRLSTIRSADTILVLDGGEIVERGSYDELLALGGRFRQLHDTQYRFERERFVNPGEEFSAAGHDVTRKTRRFDTH
ncbi:MAG: ABC transporter ATP-binding protein [Planctomycetota bacterium]